MLQKISNRSSTKNESKALKLAKDRDRSSLKDSMLFLPRSLNLIYILSESRLPIRRAAQNIEK